MRRFLLLAALTLTSIGVLAAPAFSVIEGPCDAYFNRIHFDDLDTPDEAKDRLVLLPGEALNFSGAVYGDIDALRVDIVFRPFTITIIDAYEPDGQAAGAETFDVEVPIEFLARFGSGIYEFQGSTDICSGNAYFVLGGVDVQDTLIGQIALGTVGLGGLIGLTSWIPTLFTGRVGWGRDIFGGILIGIGAAVVAQQAGEVPLGAMSAGVGVGVGIGGSVLIDKISAGINGIFSGGGSAMPPPPAAPPPTPQSFPDTFQVDQPEFTRSADTFQGGGESDVRPEFTRSADTFQGSQPDVVKADPAGAFDGSTPTGQPDTTPDFTRSADTFQGAGQSGPGPEFTQSADTFQGSQPQVKPDSADAFGGEQTQVKPDSADAFGGTAQPTGQAPGMTSISDTFQAPSVDPATTAGGTASQAPPGGTASQAPSAPEMTSISDTFQAPAGDAPAGGGTPPQPAGGSGAGTPGSPVGQTPAPGGTSGGTGTPSPPTGQVSPPDLTVPGQPGAPPGGGGAQPGGGGTAPSAGTPSGATPASGSSAPGAPSPAGASPGGGIPLKTIAGVAAPVALSSLAKSAAKHKKGKASAKDAYWFYVEGRTPVFSLEDHSHQVGELRPGAWYLARATYDEWVHMRDEDAGIEGWVPGWAARRQG